MRLHNILYGAAILSIVVGIAGIDGWMIKGTSLLIPVTLIAVGVVLWFWARKEDGCIRKKDRRTL